MAVVHQHDEVRSISTHVGSEAVGNLESEVVVLRVRRHSRMRFDDATELGLPLTIEHDPVDVILWLSSVNLSRTSTPGLLASEVPPARGRPSSPCTAPFIWHGRIRTT